MTPKRCIDCGTITTNTRCTTCEQIRNRERNKTRDHYKHNYRSRRRATLDLAQQHDEPCWICQQPINWDATPPHPTAPTADHVIPGDPNSPLLPAHFHCNSKRRNTQ
jgi:hypothetical protein